LVVLRRSYRSASAPDGVVSTPSRGCLRTRVEELGRNFAHTRQRLGTLSISTPYHVKLSEWDYTPVPHLTRLAVERQAVCSRWSALQAMQLADSWSDTRTLHYGAAL